MKRAEVLLMSQSEDEEPRIKDVLSNLSSAVSKERSSDLLHSMATSRDILFWTPRRQLLRNKRIIPVTNVAELVEYVLLPHKDDESLLTNTVNLYLSFLPLFDSL